MWCGGVSVNGMSSPTVLLLLLVFSTFHVQGNIIEGPSNITYLPGVTPLPIELTCNVTGQASWEINNTSYRFDQLDAGRLQGHNRTGTNILVYTPGNNTKYICVSQVNNNFTLSDPAYIIIADVPDKVPSTSITVDDDSIKINGTNVTLTLSWGEPFNNLDPIVNYTLSWNNGTFRQSFIATTRSYTITDLTPMTNYTFSVVATNSVGSGEAGTLIYTTEVIEQVTGVILACVAEGFNNTCSATWTPVRGRNITVYQVCYNGTMKNVTSSDTTLNFTAPPILGDVFMDNVAVTVAAFNRFGVGPSSDPKTEPIYGSSVTNVTVTGFFSVRTQLTTNDSDKDVYISYIIAITDITSLNISDITNVIFSEGSFNQRSSVVLSPEENFTVLLAPSNRSIQLSVVDANDTSSAVAGMVNTTVVDIKEEYNVSVACNIHSESMADVCMVVAMATDSNPIQDIAKISNNMANVMLSGLNCDEEYTIIAGGMLDGNLVGPKSDQGIIYKLVCGPISELLNRILSVLDSRLALTGTTVLLAILLSIASFLLTMIVLGVCGTFLNEWKTEKTTFILVVIWILFIASFGLGLLFLRIYQFCCRREGKTLNELRNKPRKLALFFILGVLTCGISCVVWKCIADKDVQPDKVEMQSGDVYASPKKKETDAEATSTDQGLYSYARTGPINVIVPGEKL